MIIDLNSDLQPASYHYQSDRSSVLAKTVPPSDDRRRQAADDSKERFLRTSVPEDARVYHSNYLTYLTTAWAQHQSIVFTPDIVWFATLNEIAKAVVAMPEPHRSLFTRSPDKITIRVPVSAVDAPLPLDLIIGQLVEKVPVDVQMFLPTFSTTTEMAKLAFLASFAETCTPYYRYETFLCGFPRIRIDGGVDDYDLIVGRALAIYNEFDRIDSPLMPWFTNKLMPWLSNIADAVHKKDARFFTKMIATERCGSGGDIEINGWWSLLFREQPSDRKPQNFPTQIARVPWENAETKRQFTLNCGLFHSIDEADFLSPQFGWVQNEIVA